MGSMQLSHALPRRREISDEGCAHRWAGRAAVISANVRREIVS